MKQRALTSFLILTLLFGINFSQRPVNKNAWFANLQNISNYAFVPTAFGADRTNEANLVRFLYFMVVGPPSSGYPSGTDGPPSGLVGMINEILGPDALGGGLARNGVTTCADIPTTSSSNMSVTDEGATFAMSFDVGSDMNVPAGWTNGGEGFDKKISVARNGTSFMLFRAHCDSNTGYILMDMDDGQGTTRSIETVFQFDSATNTARVELLMVATGTQTDRMIVKFETTDGDTFSLWKVRTDGTTSGDAIGIHGKKSANIANMTHITDNDGDYSDTTDLHTPGANFDECIDFSTNQDGANCGAESLDVSDPGTPALGSGGTPGFHIEWVGDSMALTSL